MDMLQLLQTARDLLTVERVFGTPVERDGATVIPVAKVLAGGGGGQGEGADESGSGAGGAVIARPLGVFVVADGDARWRPAIDADRLVLGGQVVVIVALLAWRSVARAQLRAAAR